ncbi:MAG: 4-hydroxy-tetrahydrodipicolinate synthase [Candidatus Puniceispirillum sp.]|nr:4-hydroxy-tetrahydrodipicolinate synthase [Candidatus Pelagibacter sp.]MBA4282883.1 4-hydroxy-tetrahydrodipicolinate synthase [Candidatus Puniceispirillum sp.]
MFSGSIVALVTPFKNKQIDEQSLINLIHMHINAGTSGVLVCGSTGEGNLLSQDERNKITALAKEEINGSVPLIIGCGHPSVEGVVESIQQAQKIGIDAALVVAPYYVKPTQRGLIQFYKEVHDQTNTPILLYNNPARTCVDIAPDTIIELSKLQRIVGLKDSNPDAARFSYLKRKVKGEFCLLSGEDRITPAHLLHGAVGTISVVANIIPKLCTQQVKTWETGDLKTFINLNDSILKCIDILSEESNPSAIKAMMATQGLITNELRIPLLPACENFTKKSLDFLKDFKIEN